MRRGVFRVFVLPFLLGVTISFCVVGTYWGLERLLVNCADYDRGVWEGAVLVMVFSAGHALANLVLKRFDAWRQQTR